MEQIGDNIVLKCQNGDKSAFRLVVQKYQQMVFSLALKMLCDEEEAKDATQDSFIKVWVNIRNFDSKCPFSTWIYTIALRVCLDRLKTMKRQIPLPEDERVLAEYVADANPQRQLENREWISVVRILAEGLSEKQRLVFTLSHLEGLDSAEIEVITGFDAKQIKSNLYVARQTIKERLKMLGYE